MRDRDRLVHAREPLASVDNVGKNSQFREFYGVEFQALWKETQVSAWEDIQTTLESLEVGVSVWAGQNLHVIQND